MFIAETFHLTFVEWGTIPRDVITLYSTLFWSDRMSGQRYRFMFFGFQCACPQWLGDTFLSFEPILDHPFYTFRVFFSSVMCFRIRSGSAVRCMSEFLRFDSTLSVLGLVASRHGLYVSIPSSFTSAGFFACVSDMCACCDIAS